MTSDSGARTALPYTVLHGEYGDVEARVKSFTGWPGRVVGQDPKVMAVTGLFYIGSADRVRCFSCGTTLRNWQPHNDPLDVHLRVASQCTFLQAITKKHPPANPANPGETSGVDAPASGQGPPRAGVKDSSASSAGGSRQVVRGSAASAISDLDRGSFGPSLRGSGAGAASGSGREGPPPNSQTTGSGREGPTPNSQTGLGRIGPTPNGHTPGSDREGPPPNGQTTGLGKVASTPNDQTTGFSRVGPIPNNQTTGSGRVTSPPNGQTSVLGRIGPPPLGSGRLGPTPNGQTPGFSRGGSTPNGQTPAAGVTSASAKTSVGLTAPGFSPNAASISKGSTSLVQGPSTSGVAGGPLGPCAGGPATRMTSGEDRGPLGVAVVAPRAQAACSTSGDLCEDCPSGPVAAASTSSYNRGNNSRRQESNSVISLGQELSSPAVLAVVEMGVPRQAVEAVLRDRKSRGLLVPPTAVELYMACQDVFK